MFFNEKYKAVNVPIMTYDMILLFAKCHNCSMAEAARRLFFNITMNFWLAPSSFGCSVNVDDD